MCVGVCVHILYGCAHACSVRGAAGKLSRGARSTPARVATAGRVFRQVRWSFGRHVRARRGRWQSKQQHGWHRARIMGKQRKTWSSFSRTTPISAPQQTSLPRLDRTAAADYGAVRARRARAPCPFARRAGRRNPGRGEVCVETQTPISSTSSPSGVYIQYALLAAPRPPLI
jgi:hypothetical protein